MKPNLAILALLLLAPLAHAIQPDKPSTQPTSAPSSQSQNPPLHFKFLDVYIDSGQSPLAAYQFELLLPPDSATIVGIEGADAPPFNKAPYHDALELVKNRVIIAAFTTSATVPHGKTRVARVHLAIKGDANPKFTAKLMTAGNPDGHKIPAEVSLVEPEAKGESK